jgi:membrane-bound metal-dependent hydrolase YbcI (DUF457 family)
MAPTRAGSLSHAAHVRSLARGKKEMPNGKTHVVAGTTAGALVAGFRTRPEDGPANLLVVVGGGVGGYITARWPDVFEPANSPHHRKFAHSATTGAAILQCAIEAVPEWESHWRRVAIEVREQRADPNRTPFEQAILIVVELLAWALVGLFAGLAAGYVSHLALDFVTPASLPLLGLSGSFRPSAG